MAVWCDDRERRSNLVSDQAEWMAKGRPVKRL